MSYFQSSLCDVQACLAIGLLCRSCLEIANEEGLTTLAFPAISCGAYKFPREDAAHVSLLLNCAFQNMLTFSSINAFLIYDAVIL